MTLAAHIYVDPRERRGDERTAVMADATVRADAAPIDAVVAVLSATGCLLQCDSMLGRGASISIGIAGIGIIPAHVVRAGPDGYGCAFDRPIPGEAAARLAAASVVVPFDPAGRTLSGQDGAIPHWSPRARLVAMVGSALLVWSAIAAGVAIAIA